MKKATFTTLIKNNDAIEAKERAGYILNRNDFYFGIYKENNAWYIFDLITGLKCDMAGYLTRKDAERGAGLVSVEKVADAIKQNLQKDYLYTAAIKERATAAGFMDKINQFMDDKLSIEELSAAAAKQKKAPESYASVNVFTLQAVKDNSIEYLQKDIMNASDAAGIFRAFLKNNIEEYFNILCLNNRGIPVGIHEVSHGGISQSPVHPREVFKRALLNNAASIIISHNHPGGNPEPSKADIEVTKRIQDAGKILGIAVLDHIILGDNNSYYSLASNGLM